MLSKSRRQQNKPKTKTTTTKKHTPTTKQKTNKKLATVQGASTSQLLSRQSFAAASIFAKLCKFVFRSDNVISEAPSTKLTLQRQTCLPFLHNPAKLEGEKTRKSFMSFFFTNSELCNFVAVEKTGQSCRCTVYPIVVKLRLSLQS